MGDATRMRTAYVKPIANGARARWTRPFATARTTATSRAVAMISMSTRGQQLELDLALGQGRERRVLAGNPFAVVAKNVRVVSPAFTSSGSFAGIVRNRAAAASAPPTICASQ